jgi:hypothetical protein
MKSNISPKALQKQWWKNIFIQRVWASGSLFLEFDYDRHERWRCKAVSQNAPTNALQMGRKEITKQLQREVKRCLRFPTLLRYIQFQRFNGQSM